MEQSKSLTSKDYLKYGLHFAILIGVIFAAVKYLNGEEIWSALKSFNYNFAPPILLLSTVYLLLKAWRFVLLMEPFDGDLPWLVAFKAYVAGQAATLLPGGIVARAGLMKQVDVPVAKSSVPVIFSSAIDQAIFIVGSLGAALWFEAARTPAFILLGVITAVVLLYLIPASRHWLASAADWVAKKLNGEEKWRTFLEAIPQVLTWRIMLSSFALTLLAFTAGIIALDLALRGIGLDLGYPTLFLGYILPTMMGRLVPVPGGVGVTEAGMVGFLATTSPANANELTAAVAIFRIGTVFFNALLGAIVYYAFWRGEKEKMATSTT
jgi:uncharacterized protein (TIRG00374 family)